MMYEILTVSLSFCYEFLLAQQNKVHINASFNLDGSDQPFFVCLHCNLDKLWLMQEGLLGKHVWAGGNQ